MMSMKPDLTYWQQNAPVDTLTQSYSDQWEAMESLDQASPFVQFMGSNDLIFVVLGVSLIIWFVLLFYLMRVDRKLTRLEDELDLKMNSKEQRETT